MVGVADIPCVGKFVERISENTVDAVFRGLRYVFRYKAFVNELKSETDKLNIQMKNMSEKIEEEKANGKKIKDHVEKWKNEAEEIQKSDKEFSPSCKCIQLLPIPNPVSRFRIGRNAAKKAISVAQLTNTGKDYLTGGIASLPQVKNMPKPDAAFEEFESRKDAYKKLWDALVNKDSPLVHGIYGMAGVGKTRMMEKFWEDAMEKDIFKKVVRVNVGNENLDKMKLQDQIAGRLNCHLDSQDVESRATQLEESFKNGGKILLILDDLWDEIPLDNIIGTPFGSSGSKILLTSRDKRVCELNDCEHPVEVKTLSPDEALDLFKKLWDALVNEDSPLIHGIYGMAGVGKTRMMEKFWEDAMEKDIFKKVVRVNVGNENLDKMKLQDLIAGRLNCKLESQDVESRAAELEKSFKNGGKILLILEDLWDKIPLDNIIGTPFGSSGCKILVTSRQKDVCLINKCKHLVEIKTLNSDEAMYLFKNTVGPDTIDSLQDKSWVRKICDECGHLPLLIQAVGKALEHKGDISWKDAHDQLKNGKFEKIPGVPPKVYAGIKLSIDYLQQDDAKSCLFLCSLFPEDAEIDMKMLIQLATGSQLIPDGKSRVLSMVGSLKESSLLLDSGKHNETKVHDIIRDVARSIAFTDSKYAFLQVTCNSGYLPTNANYRTRKLLRLDVETDDVHFYEDPVFPDLDTLWLQCKNHPQQFLGGFFTMFANLRFLMLQNVNISLEKFSLQPLVNLRTLNLFKCDIRKTDVSLFLERLETLCICYCQLPVPMNVGNLNYLRKLEIQVEERRPKLVMGSNVISSLSRLEELHIPNGYIIEHEEYVIDPIVTEISELTHLTSLQFQFYNDDTFQGRNVFYKLERYSILVGEFDNGWEQYNWVKTLGRVIWLYGNHLQSWEGLMARAEEVRLVNSDIEVSSICNSDGRAFEDLKVLYIKRCNMGHLARISQDDGLQHGATCFSKLIFLRIESCSKLKYIFCNNFAKNLLQLQELTVWDCESMEAIIMNEGTSHEKIINFPKLKSLTISYMLTLASFYAEKKNMNAGSTVPMGNSAQHQPFFYGKVAFPFLEELNIITCENMEYIQPATCFSKLTRFGITSCPKLKYLFCNNIAKNLSQLQNLRVYNCKSMEAIITNEGTTDGKIINFPKLKYLEIRKISRLASFYAPSASTLSMDPAARCFFDGMVAFPSLEQLVIESMPYTSVIWGKDCFNDTVSSFSKLKHLTVSECDKLEIVIPHAMLPRLSNLECIRVYNCSNLRTMFPPSVASHLRHLTELTVEDCREMREIIEEGEQVITDGILFPELTVLKLLNLPSLTSFWCYQSEKARTCKVPLRLPQLSSISLDRLPELRRLFHGANFEFYVPALKKVKVDTCGLSTLFTFSMFRKFQFQLEHLEVRNCELLENIVEDVRADETCDNIIRLSQLTAVKFENLPNLKSFFHTAVYEFHMPVIKEVIVRNCGFSTLFTFSMFRKFQFQLEKLEVRNCELLENIVEDVRADETCDNIIRLSQLTAVKFKNLPNLKSFFHTAVYKFDMPVIKEVIVRNCGLFNDPSFQALSSGIWNNSDSSCSSTDLGTELKKSLRKLRLQSRGHWYYSTTD